MEITVQELKLMEKGSYQIIDIRNEVEVSHGAIPGAVNLMPDSIEGNPEINFNKKLVICCSRGKLSVEIAERLSEKDYDAVSLSGGYIAWLLDWMKEEKDKEISRDVEQSIRKNSGKVSGVSLQRRLINMNW